MVWSVLPEVRFIEQNKKTVYYVTPCDKLYSVQFKFSTDSFCRKGFCCCCFYQWRMRCTVDVYCSCNYLDVGARIDSERGFSNSIISCTICFKKVENSENWFSFPLHIKWNASKTCVKERKFLKQIMYWDIPNESIKIKIIIYYLLCNIFFMIL